MEPDTVVWGFNGGRNIVRGLLDVRVRITIYYGGNIWTLKSVLGRDPTQGNFTPGLFFGGGTT